jgi:hypothetical protein
MSVRKPKLTTDQQRAVDRARELAAMTAGNAGALSAGYEYVNPDDRAQVYAYAFGFAQSTVRNLLDVINNLTGGSP